MQNFVLMTNLPSFFVFFFAKQVPVQFAPVTVLKRGQFFHFHLQQLGLVRFGWGVKLYSLNHLWV